MLVSNDNSSPWLRDFPKAERSLVSYLSIYLLFVLVEIIEAGFEPKDQLLIYVPFCSNFALVPNLHYEIWVLYLWNYNMK